MKELIIRLLDLSHQLDEANLGEFDFGRLQDILSECQHKAPGILQMEQEYNILKNHLLLQIKSKRRALDVAQNGSSGTLWNYVDESLAAFSAEKLLKIHASLCSESNTVFASKPNFLRIMKPRIKHENDQNYKIGG